MTKENVGDSDIKGVHRETPQKLEKWEIISKLLPSSGLILDVGCYNGTFSRYFRTYACNHGISYVGVNVSRQTVKEAKTKKLDSVLASCDFLPFRSESFDACSLLHMVEHIYFPDSAIKEANRILNPNGKLILVARNFANFIDRVHMLIGMDIIPGSEESELVRFFTWKSLNVLLSRHGFKLEKREMWFLPFPARRITNKYISWRKFMKLAAKLFPNMDESLIGSWRKTAETLTTSKERTEPAANRRYSPT